MTNDDLQVRPQLSDILDVANLRRQIENGNISVKPHPTYRLVIYNYTPQANFSDNTWDNEVMQCRGLIVDAVSREIVARPFKKFFNLNTSYRPETFTDVLPKTPPQVLDKMDGSLGILYEWMGVSSIATRGSFESDQAKWATAWYRDHVRTLPSGAIWPEGWTPLFEIIYPENRIVLQYDFEGLALIGMIHNATGEEMPHHGGLAFWAEQNGLRCTETYSFSDLHAVVQEPIDTHNREGFVLTWFDPYIKVKVKFEEYCRLHRIITGLNPKSVWEMLQTNEGEEQIRAMYDDKTLPVAFRAWLMTVKDELTKWFLEIEDAAGFVVDRLPEGISRKDAALRILKTPFLNMGTPAVCFHILDGKDPAPVIWKMIKPKGAQPFREDGEA